MYRDLEMKPVTSTVMTRASTIWSLLLRSDGHFSEVTVTSEVTSRCPRSLGSDVS